MGPKTLSPSAPRGAKLAPARDVALPQCGRREPIPARLHAYYGAIANSTRHVIHREVNKCAHLCRNERLARIDER